MPIYEFICQDCGKKFDALRSMNQADQPISCTNCFSKKTKRILSKFYAHSETGTFAGSSSSCTNCRKDSCSTCGQ